MPVPMLVVWLFFACPLAPSPAQELVPLLRSNDVFGGEPVFSLDSPLIDAHEDWAALVATFHTPNPHRRLVSNGELVASEGDLLPDASARVNAWINIAGSRANLTALLELVPPVAPDAPVRALVRGGRVLVRVGDPLGAAGLPAGTLCRAIHACGANERDTVVALIETGNLEYALVRFVFAADGDELLRSADLRTGQTLPDGSTAGVIALDGQQQFAQSVNERGDWMWRVSGSDDRERLVTRERVLLREGDPAPVPGRTLLELHAPVPVHHGFDSNDLGGWAALVRLSGDPASGVLLVENGVKLAQQGDVLPALAPDALVELDDTCVRLSDSGHVYWVAHTSGSPTRAQALMRDLDVVARTGVTMVGNQKLSVIDGNNLEITADGRFVVVRAALLTDRLLLRFDLGACVPIPGCGSNPGSLRLSSGFVLAGRTVRLELDGPAPAGAVARVHSSLGAAIPGNPCGVLTPFGELLIDPTRRLPSFVAGVVTSGGVSSAVSTDVPIPADPTLVDLEPFSQGSFTSPSGVFRTNALHLTIGAP